VEQHLEAWILTLLAEGTGCIQPSEHIFIFGVLDGNQVFVVIELAQMRLLIVEAMEPIMLNR